MDIGGSRSLEGDEIGTRTSTEKYQVPGTALEEPRSKDMDWEEASPIYDKQDLWP